MLKNNFIFLIGFLLTMTSCKTGVVVTFTNESEENFKSLKVDVDRKYVIFENIKSGESTIPLKVSGSYPYCFAKIITEKDTLIFRPIDFMGEKYHSSGKLKMKLKIIVDENGKRYIDFVNP